jgi:hypothetical protein
MRAGTRASRRAGRDTDVTPIWVGIAHNFSINQKNQVNPKKYIGALHCYVSREKIQIDLHISLEREDEGMI